MEQLELGLEQVVYGLQEEVQPYQLELVQHEQLGQVLGQGLVFDLLALVDGQGVVLS
jgi:hypothetical protein